MRKTFSTKQIAVGGIATALVAVATMVFQIPIVATSGYVNFGDTMIFIIAILISPISAMIAGGIGSAIADVFTGYSQWALITLVIKGLEGLICGLIVVKFKKTHTGKAIKAMSLLAMTVAGLFMTVGYFFGGWILFGTWQASVVSVPNYLVQAGMSIALAFIIIFVLKLIKTQNYLNNY